MSKDNKPKPKEEQRHIDFKKKYSLTAAEKLKAAIGRNAVTSGKPEIKKA